MMSIICYKKYTAYNTSIYITEEEVESKVSFRFSTTPCSSKTSGVLEPVCLFRNRERKKFKGRWLQLGSCEKFDVEISIREAADKLEDENIKRKIGNYKYKKGPDFIALEVKCHHECKREYPNKVRNTKSNSTLEQSVYNIRKSTFEDIVSYIKETVVHENKPQFRSDILDRYKPIYQVKG